MEENSIPSRQSSDVHFVSDFEKDVEKIFDWTFDGLKMKGLLNKSAADIAVVKRVMLEKLRKYELELETEILGTKSNDSIKGDLLLLPNETKNDETIQEAHIDNLELQGGSSDSKTITEVVEKSDNDTDANEIWDNYYESLNEIEEGELSCSTENTAVDEDEENIVSNINSALNSLLFIHPSESSSIIKDRFLTKLKINTPDDAVSFVDKVFKVCLEDTKASKVFVDLIELSLNIPGQIPSTLRTETWKNCVDVFGRNIKTDSELLGFSYSENPDEIKETKEVIMKNYNDIPKKDNIIYLVELLFKKGLVLQEEFTSFVFKLLTLATTVDYCGGSFRYLCSLLSAVGFQYEKQLKLSKNTILMDTLFKNIQDFKNRNANLPTEIARKINGLILLRNNNWETEETDNLQSSSNAHGTLNSTKASGSKNEPSSSTVHQTENKTKEKRKNCNLKRKTAGPRANKQNRNQRKCDNPHPYKNNPRNFNLNQRNKSRQLEEELQKQRSLQDLLLTNHLLLKHQNLVVPPQTMPRPRDTRNTVPSSYIDNRTPGAHQNQRQNFPGNRGGRNPNYRAGGPPNVAHPKNRNNNRRNRRSPSWQNPKGSHMARKNIPSENL